MVNTLPTVIPLGSKSRVSDTQFHPGINELYNNNNSRNYRGDNYNNVWFSSKQMEWRWSNSLLNFFRWYSRFRFSLESNYTRFRFHSRNSNKSGKSGIRSNRNRKNYRNFCYYYLIISLLTIGPIRAEEGETNNTSNPVAAATGNVTNQAVQFQNNGAPSRQHYGPNISCNGSTMTFSPFYMGNHTTPWDENLVQQSYTAAENWGFQVNFMVPLDKGGLEQCRRIAKRQEEKMMLDYELVRAKECANLQAKGFMLVPGSRVYHMCSDVIAISAWLKAEQTVLKCTTPPKPWYKPWSKSKQPNCKTMSTLSDQYAKEAAKAQSKTKKKTKSTETK